MDKWKLLYDYLSKNETDEVKKILSVMSTLSQREEWLEDGFSDEHFCKRQNRNLRVVCFEGDGWCLLEDDGEYVFNADWIQNNKCPLCGADLEDHFDE